MNYSVEDIQSLIKFLKVYKPKYNVVRQFFKSHLSHLPNGLSEPGTVGSAYVIEQIKILFPDVYHALTMPEKDLPLYINPEIGQEYPVAVWRLQRKGK